MPGGRCMWPFWGCDIFKGNDRYVWQIERARGIIEYRRSKAAGKNGRFVIYRLYNVVDSLCNFVYNKSTANQNQTNRVWLKCLKVDSTEWFLLSLIIYIIQYNIYSAKSTCERTVMNGVHALQVKSLNRSRHDWAVSDGVIGAPCPWHYIV